MPGPWTPSGGEYFPGDRDGGHRFGPACVEGQVDDGLFEFGLGRAVGLCACEVSAELVGAAAGDEAGDRDEAAVPRGEFAPFPDVAEEQVVGEVHQLGGEVTDEL